MHSEFSHSTCRISRPTENLQLQSFCCRGHPACTFFCEVMACIDPSKLLLLLLLVSSSCQAWWCSSSSSTNTLRPSFVSAPCSLSSAFSGQPMVAMTVTNDATFVMRKQKASDKRTSRRQRQGDTETTTTTITRSPMQSAHWNAKTTPNTVKPKTGGRGRSRKRSNAYLILQHYQNQFVRELTLEYKTEEETILSRMKRDPILLEKSGDALFDMELDYRGVLYSEHVYRLSKQETVIHHDKFKLNDMILLTEQPHGRGDLFHAMPLKNPREDLLQARILNMGPSYIDIVVPNVIPQTNHPVYYRVDPFISPVTYERMVNALSQLTSLSSTNTTLIRMDDTIREAILSTYAFTDASSPVRGDPEICQLEALVR